MLAAEPPVAKKNWLRDMDTFHGEIFRLPEWMQFLRVSARLLIAAFLGGCIGFERQREHKAAGLRTHIVVTMGAALFAIAPLEAGMSLADAGRVFQGIAAGIGFIGAGTILKLTEQQEIKGLTTAAGLWLTAAIGMAVGSGLLWIPILATFFTVVILFALTHAERRMNSGPKSDERSECKPDRAKPSIDERSECKPDRAKPSIDDRERTKAR